MGALPLAQISRVNFDFDDEFCEDSQKLAIECAMVVSSTSVCKLFFLGIASVHPLLVLYCSLLQNRSNYSSSKISTCSLHLSGDTKHLKDYLISIFQAKIRKDIIRFCHSLVAFLKLDHIKLSSLIMVPFD